MTDIHKLIDVITAHGIPAPTASQLEKAINTDKFTRWPTTNNQSKKPGFCKLNEVNGVLWATFGSFNPEVRGNWSSKSRNDMTPSQWQDHTKSMEEFSKQAKESTEFKAAQAAIRAQERWKNAKPADDSNPYLLTKNVRPHGSRVDGENLLIPCYRLDDETGSFTISTLQTISPDGECFKKRFLFDSTKKGGFYEITNKEAPKDHLILCEGFATGASIFEATGISTLVCFDAGNLLTVAKTIRSCPTSAFVRQIGVLD